MAAKRWGWSAPVGAAAATILAAGTLVLATQRSPAEPAPPLAPVPGAVPGLVRGSAGAPVDGSAPGAPLVPSRPASGPAGLIVRDGDPVEVSGPVEDSVMCAPAPVLLPAGGGPCRDGIRVPGVRPAGGVTVRGRWHRGRLSDIRRMPYSPTAAGALPAGYDFPDVPPCPAPAGGWSVGEDWLHRGLDEPVLDYLDAHAGRFAEPFATHSGNARVLVVQVVNGDVGRARAVLTAMYRANLCVVAAPGGHSIAAGRRLRATTGKAVEALMDDPAAGIYTAQSEGGRIRVNMVVLTEPLYDRFAAIGLNRLVLDPWVRPVGR